MCAIINDICEVKKSVYNRVRHARRVKFTGGLNKHLAAILTDHSANTYL